MNKDELKAKIIEECALLLEGDIKCVSEAIDESFKAGQDDTFKINDMNEEYLKGARIIITFLREEGIICKSIDNCGECSKVDKFMKKLEKKVKL